MPVMTQAVQPDGTTVSSKATHLSAMAVQARASSCSAMSVISSAALPGCRLGEAKASSTRLVSTCTSSRLSGSTQLHGKDAWHSSLG